VAPDEGRFKQKSKLRANFPRDLLVKFPPLAIFDLFLAKSEFWLFLANTTNEVLPSLL